MRTPAGKECPYYHEDFHRGRNTQECRLIQGNRESLPWRPSDCAKCKVPEIRNANASKHLELKVTVKPRFMGMGRLVEVTPYCRGEEISIEAAFTDCGEKSPGLDLFRQALEPDDDD